MTPPFDKRGHAYSRLIQERIAANPNLNLRFASVRQGSRRTTLAPIHDYGSLTG